MKYHQRTLSLLKTEVSLMKKAEQLGSELERASSGLTTEHCLRFHDIDQGSIHLDKCQNIQNVQSSPLFPA